MNRALLSTLVAAALAGQGCTGEGTAKAQAATAAPSPEVTAAAAGHDDAPSAPKLCEHGVPSDICTKCNPDLAAAYKEMGDWCDEHGVPESQCLKCNPGLSFEAATAQADWCKEHAVPESMCTKCKPKLIEKFIAAGDFCREHGYPESVCPYCHPDKVKAAGHPLPVFPEPGTKIRLASVETEKEAGIETIRAEERPFARTIEVVGQLDFDQNKLARLSARGDATVVAVKVDAGEDVRRGQALVVLTSGSVGGAQSGRVAAEARIDTARKMLEREEQLAGSGISSRQDVERARAELASAEAERDSALAELRSAGAATSGSGGRYTLVAPFDGTVVARDAVAGRTVGEDDVLVELADVRTLWAVLEVPEEQASGVHPGQRVTLRVDGTGVHREARVTRVNPAVDRRTRTVRVRVDVGNEDRALRAGSFIRASIEVSEPRSALILPRDAVQRAQEHDVVFVRTRAGEYDPVEVHLGASTRDEVEVVAGLEPGAEVVTAGAFVLKTEILKDSIGAGCADGD